jgi:hypothetical protein
MTERQKFKVVAHHPGIKDLQGGVLLTEIQIPREQLDGGPRGHRLAVIDYDASWKKLYAPPPVDAAPDAPVGKILGDPGFHARNVYAIAMRTLTRFEQALGRRVGWGFDGQQLKISPHAFAMENAFYSKRDQALLFGYFRGPKGWIFTSLSHDVIVHETTHAILDGLRERYVDVSHPDQAGFHEGFADLVALLSVYSLRDVVSALLPGGSDSPTLSIEATSLKSLKDSVLLGVGGQLGDESKMVRGALRRSVNISPSIEVLNQHTFKEPHRRGEVLVAAVMNAFLEVWRARLVPLSDGQSYHRERVVEEGADVADRLLTRLSRALDYTPPVDIRFADYLSALLTSDTENRPNDDKYEFRKHLRSWFGKYGIDPASNKAGDGCWERPPEGLKYDRTHFESLRTDETEIFRFLWENRKQLGLDEDAYSRVMSVRPCLRVVQDGFIVRETVAEYSQLLHVQASHLPKGVERPTEMNDKHELMPSDQELKLHGGGTLVFDEYGRLKYHVHQRTRGTRQTEQLKFLWKAGLLSRPTNPPPGPSQFAALHRQRLAVRDDEGPTSDPHPLGRPAGAEPFPDLACVDADQAPAHTRWFCHRVNEAHDADVAGRASLFNEPLDTPAGSGG